MMKDFLAQLRKKNTFFVYVMVYNLLQSQLLSESHC